MKMRVIAFIGEVYEVGIAYPKCSTHIGARLAKTGVHKGKLFVNCGNFSDCRFVAE